MVAGTIKLKDWTMNPGHDSRTELTERLATSGFRFTSQRRHVYDVLMRKRDHPTAEEVFIRSKRAMPDISMATVYNCLDALVQCGLVRQVQLQRGATRFCPNMEEHCHYHCGECGAVFDVPLSAHQPAMLRPRGFKVDHYDIAVHGLCASCAAKRKK
jgi:Fur family peroxide stress response transcriptional regulator